MVSDVIAAQAGDRAAFSRLVARFQGMAVAYAFSWVGDLAEDVAQDAFVDVFLHLDQLREPAAFPGWLRRVVRKHSDRRTRKKRALVDGAEPTAVLDETLLERAWLLRGIAELPEHERVVVALHYLGDEPQQDVSEFLELPLSTIKKRLHSARAKLRERESNSYALQSPAPFCDHVAFFLAIRAGDVALARAILDRLPALLDSEEQWTAEEALSGGFPLPHRLTPLIVAAGRGDSSMVDMLLERGAQIDKTCGCRNGETALWTASRCGHAEVVEKLLSAGADPNVKNYVGFTPAQVAALRSTDRVRIIGTRIETGIKAIDLLAPLETGMIVRVHGQAETGLMVLLAELTCRFDQAVWISFAKHPWQQRELEAFAAECGVRPEIGGDWRGRPVFVFAEEGRQAELEAHLPRLREARIAFVVDPWTEATREPNAPEFAPPYDALIVTDPLLAEAGIYPAIDRRETCSNAIVSAQHAKIARAVREAQSEAVRRFFQQWFGVYQHQTGHPGESWSVSDMLTGFAELL